MSETLFVYINYLTAFATAFVFVLIFRKRKALLVKPSIFFLLFFHLCIQWSATLFAKYTFLGMQEPLDFFVLTQIFPLVGLLLVYRTFNSSTSDIWERITKDSFSINFGIIAAYTCAVFVITTAYIAYIGIANTGLYAMFFDPAHYPFVREKSLKLLDSVAMKYVYSIMSTALAPVLTIMLVRALAEKIRQHNYGQSLLLLLMLAIVFFSVNLTGARWSAILPVLACGVAFIYRRGVPLKMQYILLALFTLIMIPTLSSLIRQGWAINPENIWFFIFGYQDTNNFFFGSGIFNRIFFSSMKVGWDHVHYVMTYGYWGVAGIPKLALLAGVKPVNVPNFIYQFHFYKSGITSGSYSSGYIFSLYSYFGLWTVILSWLMLMALDIIMYLYRRLDKSLLLPCISSVSVACIALLASDYTTSLLTHGIGTTVLIGLCVSMLSRRLADLIRLGRNKAFKRI